MKNRIITSTIPLKRSPVTAFILSFIFTGLGQIYNGDLSRGIVLFVLRILSLVIIPFYAVLRSADSCLPFFAIALAFHILIWLASPCESLIGARRKGAENKKTYNSIIFYFIYGILSIALLMLAVLFVSFFFNFKRVSADRMNPTILKDEYILINKYAVNNVNIGDVAAYTNKKQYKIGRIIAKVGEIVSIRENVFYINDTALQLGILTDAELSQMGLNNSEDLFYELNGGRKYPIKTIPPKSTSISRKSKDIYVRENMLFISPDNRVKDYTYKLIDHSQLIGKVEGVLYSGKIKRLLVKPYLTN